MANILVFTTDIPFFPGKNGNDFFNLRYLSQRHSVGVVGPQHDHYPSAGMANLERILCGSYFWPRAVRPVALPPQRDVPGKLAGWVSKLPEKWRRQWLRRLLGIVHQPADAYGQLATLANCAPHLLRALADRHWQVIALIQSNTEPWLDYLPSHPAKFIYFHDVRSDYLRRRPDAALSDWQLRAIHAQEIRCSKRADVVGFVSELDQQRAVELLRPTAEIGVAPIPVDTDYYTPPPKGWRKDVRPIVLFTGHLGHPPNVDAISYFLAQIWPLVRSDCPDAVFQAVGLLPDPKLQQACAGADGVELHPNVPDIRPYFWNALVYVVPMRYGGGVRQKIFEAWTMEVPVVCTTMAAEGTKAMHGENCWLEDDPAGFAARVVERLRAPEPPVTRAAKQTVLAHNSIPAAASCFERLVERAVHIKKTRPYKLLFDLRWMKIGKAGGAEQMSYELISEISKCDRRNEYRMFCPRSTYYEWEFPRGFRCRGFFTESIKAKYAAMHARLANLLAESVCRQPLLTAEMRALRWYNRLDFDVVHSPSNYSFPDMRVFPNVLTVHDLQHIHFPEFFTQDAWTERESRYRESVSGASHIICVSEYTRMDLHKSYGVPLEKMTTVSEHPFARRVGQSRRAHAAQSARGHGVTGPVSLYPAHCWPHKNHRRLIEAFQMVEAELPADIQLVLTGRQFDDRHEARQLIEAENLQARVVHLGYRSPLEIQALYSRAHALVFPSLFEGFGMPVAEAIIADCPVACSNTTSLPEIAGDAAVYFDPQSTKGIARALLEIATDEKRRAESVAAGRRRKSAFSSRLSAMKALSVYTRVFQEAYSG